MPKFNTQFTVEENCKDFYTNPGDPIEILYDLKYSETGEPYLVPNGKKRNIYDEIQKSLVLCPDVAEMYERFINGDEDCLNVIYGGEYLDCSVWSKDMIENASRAYNLNFNSESVVIDTLNKTEESEGDKE